MSQWTAIAGRITLFPASTVQPFPSALELYKRIWESDPVNFQGATSPLAPSIAQGSRTGLAVTCTLHPSRIDFNFTQAAPEDSSGSRRLLVIENTQALHDELARVGSLIAEGLVTNPILRVATFLHLVSIEANIVEANKALMSIVPLQYRIKLRDEEEFVFQISRPHLSEQVPGVKMNYINKWSVDRFQMVSLMFSMGGSAPISPPTGAAPVLSEFITAGITFDNNNVPVGPDKPLSSAQQSSLILESLAQTAISMKEVGLNLDGF